MFNLKAHHAALQRALPTYADYDYLLQDLEKDLIERLEGIKTSFSRVFLYGARAGLLKTYVQERYAPATLICADVAMGAEGASLAFFEEEAWPCTGPYDLMISCGTWQWAQHLPTTLIRYRQHLASEGLLLASFYGGETLYELRQAFLHAEAQASSQAALRVMPMVTLETAYALLKKLGLREPAADRDVFQVTFPRLQALLKDLKGMGERLYLQSPPPPLNRALWTEVEKAYAALPTGRLPVTVERLTLTAWGAL